MAEAALAAGRVAVPPPRPETEVGAAAGADVRAAVAHPRTGRPTTPGGAAAEG
ncbi:hypothetical protein [Microbispora bryophytorum]|uniref:Uncharacterized protein n=1 Tax=Microbispora bryophytorum subsp. camponoti TaxID=1677852 RepID=A0ABR8LC75_9ACTN|nr:hypothetical protein [Microbispora camponoti]MBD3147409.1 hypothetical protein [Microbispora camponoti]